MKPLVSILIPAYNAGEWIAETIQSAIGQTWPHKEIIVVDDGSKDDTAAVAQRFASKHLLVVSKENEGAAATRNHALGLAQGDYIQWLDADDLLAPDKIELQLTSPRSSADPRVLLSSSWGRFNYRTRRARFCPSPLWQSLSPVEWLLRNIGENVFMPPINYLTSRELTEAAGPWDTRIISDDDAEYFCRVLLASKGTCFVPEARVFYRNTPSSRNSFIGVSDKRKDAKLLSMKLHVKYLRSLEESERVRKACLAYFHVWLDTFYPERPDIVAELQELATQLHGHLGMPRLRWKYAWMKPLLGWDTAKRAQAFFPQVKALLFRHWDRLMYGMERNGALRTRNVAARG